MMERGSGKIIFTASLLTFQGGITVPGYAASKGAIGQLTKALANEWAAMVCRSTPSHPATSRPTIPRPAHRPRTQQAILARIPAGRWGRPEDFKGAVVYLASDAGAYVHGES